MTTIDDIKKIRDNSIHTILEQFDRVIEKLAIQPPGKKFYVNGESKEIKELCLNLKTELTKKV